MRWTPKQEQIIGLRNRNLLVAAAAGSGKTAVLVERIMAMITDPENPVDIDRLLVVTFTRAAAGADAGTDRKEAFGAFGGTAKGPESETPGGAASPCKDYDH